MGPNPPGRPKSQSVHLPESRTNIFLNGSAPSCGPSPQISRGRKRKKIFRWLCFGLRRTNFLQFVFFSLVPCPKRGHEAFLFLTLHPEMPHITPKWRKNAPFETEPPGHRQARHPRWLFFVSNQCKNKKNTTQEPLGDVTGPGHLQPPPSSWVALVGTAQIGIVRDGTVAPVGWGFPPGLAGTRTPQPGNFCARARKRLGKVPGCPGKMVRGWFPGWAAFKAPSQLITIEFETKIAL